MVIDFVKITNITVAPLLLPQLETYFHSALRFLQGVSWTSTGEGADYNPKQIVGSRVS